MRSSSLLPQLENIPLSKEHSNYSWRDVLRESRRMRGDLFAIEIGVGAEMALDALFDGRNVPDDLNAAYGMAFSDVATEASLHQSYLDAVEIGPESVTGFVSSLKGKLAEIRLTEQLEKEFPGYEFAVADDPTQPVWDISGIDASGGEPILVQVKVGGEAYADEVLQRMQEDPDVLFAVSSEIHGSILQNHPALADQFVDVDLSNYDLTEDVSTNLNLLAANSGVDVPDDLSEILPYIGEFVLGAKLLWEIARVEREYHLVAPEERARVHAVKVLVLFARFGVTSVCSVGGGVIGSAIVPGLGTLIGPLAGVLVAAYVNNYMQPYFLEMAMWLVQVTCEDLFYFRNKAKVDNIGTSLANTEVAFS